VLILSTGEIPITTKLADRGRKARAGQLVRMLDIQADRGRGFGAFDHGGPGNDAGVLAKAFKHAAISAYGTVGPEFVRRIISEDVTGEDVRGMVADFMAMTVPARSDGQTDRAAQRLGLIATAGELATAMGLVPWQPREAWNAAARAFQPSEIPCDLVLVVASSGPRSGSGSGSLKLRLAFARTRATSFSKTFSTTPEVSISVVRNPIRKLPNGHFRIPR
jgi:hypothetical protein